MVTGVEQRGLTKLGNRNVGPDRVFLSSWICPPHAQGLTRRAWGVKHMRRTVGQTLKVGKESE